MTGFDAIVSFKNPFGGKKKSIWGGTNVDIEARVRVLGLKNLQFCTILFPHKKCATEN